MSKTDDTLPWFRGSRAALSVALAVLTAQNTWAMEYVVPLDLSRSVQPACETNKQIVTSLLSRLEAGTVTVIGITNASFAQPLILLKATIPSDSSPFKAAAKQARAQAIEDWQRQAASIQCNRGATDIFGAIWLARLHFSPNSDGKRLLPITDGRNTVGIDLESPAEIGPTASQQVRDQELMPDLRGFNLKVCFLAASTVKSPRYWESLRSFWVTAFADAGAELKDSDFTPTAQCSLLP